MTERDDADDPRRQRPIKIKWNGMIGQLTIDGESWGAIEWSEKRKSWCVEDSEGRCLTHKASIRGQAAAKDEAIALAQEMIVDGRMPSPEEAKRQYDERRQRDRERRAKQPSELRRREQREERDRLFEGMMEADDRKRRQEDETPLYELVVDSLDLADPSLWKSNSFAVLRARLITIVRAAIARLEYDIHDVGGRFWRKDQQRQDEKRLARAREILALLRPDDGAPITQEQIKVAYRRARLASGPHATVRTIVFLITCGDDPTFHGMRGDKTLRAAVKKLLAAEEATTEAGGTGHSERSTP